MTQFSEDSGRYHYELEQGSRKHLRDLENEVIGQPISILVPTDREDETPQILGRLARGQAFNHYETVRRRKDGQEIQISLQDFLKKLFTLDVLASKVREMWGSSGRLMDILKPSYGGNPATGRTQ